MNHSRNYTWKSLGLYCAVAIATIVIPFLIVACNAAKPPDSTDHTVGSLATPIRVHVPNAVGTVSTATMEPTQSPEPTKIATLMPAVEGSVMTATVTLNLSPDPTLTVAAQSQEPEPTTTSSNVGPAGGVSGQFILTILIAAFVIALVLVVAERVLRKKGIKLLPSRGKVSFSDIQAHESASSSDESRSVVVSLSMNKPESGTPYLKNDTTQDGFLYCPIVSPAIRIGRAEDNDLIIDSRFPGWQTVSLYHAKVEYDGSNVIVQDLGAANGIQVNGRRTGTNVLHDDWELSLGQVIFTFHVNS